MLSFKNAQVFLAFCHAVLLLLDMTGNLTFCMKKYSLSNRSCVLNLGQIWNDTFLNVISKSKDILNANSLFSPLYQLISTNEAVPSKE